MTQIHLQIPTDLQENLNRLSDNDIEAFVIQAIRHELDRNQMATEQDIERAAANDLDSSFLSADELKYYLNLPADV